MPVARCESAGSMRKAGGLAGVGEGRGRISRGWRGEREGERKGERKGEMERGLERVGERVGEREGTSSQQNSTDQRFKSTDQRFKTAFPPNKIQQISVLKQHNVGFFKTALGFPTKLRLTVL